MSQPRQFRYLTVSAAAIVILLLGSLHAKAQEQLAYLYRENRVLELEQLQRKGSIADPSWDLFVRSILVVDADSAVQMMGEAYRNSTDLQLRRFIRQRVSMAYFAQGYYETARRIAVDENALLDLLTTKRKSSAGLSNSIGAASALPDSDVSNGGQFGVQVGAYSTYENAVSVSRKLELNYGHSTILAKSREGQKLYVVIFGKFPTREEAERLLKTMQDRNDLHGYIIQY